MNILPNKQKRKIAEVLLDGGTVAIDTGGATPLILDGALLIAQNTLGVTFGECCDAASVLPRIATQLEADIGYSMSTLKTKRSKRRRRHK